MLKPAIVAGSAIALLSTLASAAPFASPIAMVPPLLSGTYVFTLHKFCQPELQVGYSSGSIKSLNLSGNDDNLQAGTIKFKQGSTPGAGKATLTSSTVSGSGLLVKQTGGPTGTLGDKLAKTTGSDNVTFSQTTTTLSIKSPQGTSTYDVYYGKVAGGIAQHAVFAGLDYQGCAEQGSIEIE
jgi:hypothetical protein